MRQPGSTFKLFVYTEAMNQGLTPCDRRMDSFFSMKVWDNEKKKEVIWAPTNANGYFTDYNMTLKSAFAQSINSVAVRVGQEVGIDRIIETAHKMGIKSPLHNTPSLALGASDVNLEELVNAYATVANNGRSHATILVTRILDRDGNEIYKSHEEDDEAIPYRSAFYMQQMLMAGMREPGGTSMNMWRYVRNYTDTDFGGKTGTSNNHSDAWFVGVTPRLVCGAWVGGEYRAIHFRTGELGQGSRTALPICGQFFESVLGDTKFRHYHARFANPQDASILSADYQCAGYYVDPNDSIDEAATDSIIDGENINTPDTNPMEQDSENSSDE
jgi:penicillin-binding protein 1A